MPGSETGLCSHCRHLLLAFGQGKELWDAAQENSLLHLENEQLDQTAPLAEGWISAPLLWQHWPLGNELQVFTLPVLERKLGNKNYFSNVLEDESLASFPVLKCPIQESLFCSWAPSLSQHSGEELTLPSFSSGCRREGNNLFYDETGISEEQHIHVQNGNETTQNKCGTMDVPHLLISPHPTAFTQTLLRKFLLSTLIER